MPHDGEDPHHHPLQPDHPEPKTYYEFLGLALDELLIEKGILTPGEVRAQIEAIDSLGVETHGAKVVAKAWADPDYHESLVRNAYEAVKSIGLEPGYTELVALENTPRLHNVVVCTLCSCYPRMLLGRPPVWYKSKAYRSRLVKEPRKVLAEFGTVLPDDVEVRVHDSTAELRYIVLPRRPSGTEGWSEKQLARLVTRDSMIGVSPALRPKDLRENA
jgi:nitrile hydratase